MTKNELIELGFNETDENEYSDGKYSIFIASDSDISIVSTSEDDWLCIPMLRCKTKKDLLNFFKLIHYDI